MPALFTANAGRGLTSSPTTDGDTSAYSMFNVSDNGVSVV